MDKLVNIIGLAPSELPFDQLIEKLQRERQRITTSIALWKQKGSWKQKGRSLRPEGPPARGLSMANIRALKAAGISPEKFRVLLEKGEGLRPKDE